MIELHRDIHSLTDFKRHTSAFLDRMRETEHPLVLTVNGKAEAVVLTAEAYDRLIALADRMEALDALREALDQADRGDTHPADKVFEELRRRHGVSH